MKTLPVVTALVAALVCNALWSRQVRELNTTIAEQAVVISQQRELLDAVERRLREQNDDAAANEDLRTRWRETAERCVIVLDSTYRAIQALR